MKDHVPCAKEGCKAGATHGIKICVPGVGMLVDQHRPMDITLGVRLCHTHAREIKADDFFRDPPPGSSAVVSLKFIFVQAARTRPNFVPDFDRAYISPVALDSGEWKVFESLANRNKLENTPAQGNA